MPSFGCPCVFRQLIHYHLNLLVLYEYTNNKNMYKYRERCLFPKLSLSDALLIPCFQYPEACKKFRVQMVDITNRFWKGKLILAEKVDFEQKAVYQVPLRAFVS